MKKLTGSRLANLVVVAAVLIVPLLYAGLLTLAYQNPTNRLDDITAAVVNADTPYTATLADGSSQTLALGRDLSEALTQPTGSQDVGFHWQTMSAAQARSAMAREKVRAILYIPAGFSEKAAKVGASDPSGAATQQLTLVTDDGVNYLAGTMAKTVAATLTNRLEADGSKKVLDTLLLSVGTIRSGMVEASDGATALASGAAELSTGTATASSGADSLASGVDTLSVGVKALAEGSVTLASGLTTLSTGTTTASSGANQLASGLRSLSAGTSTAATGASSLASGAETLADGTRTLAGSSTTLADGVTQLSSGSTSLKDGITAYTTGADQVAAGAAALQARATDPSSGLAAAVARLSAGVGAAGSTDQTSLVGGSAAVATGASRLSDALGTVATDGTVSTTKADGTPSLSGGASALATGAAAVAAGTSRLSDALGTVAADGTVSTTKADGTPSLSGGITQYTGAVNQLAAACKAAGDTSTTCLGLQAIAAQSSGLVSGATQAAQGAAKVNAGANQATTATAQLSAGATQAAKGAAATSAGAAQLANGTTSLAHGVAGLSAAVGSATDVTVPGDSSTPQTLLGAINAVAGGSRALTGMTTTASGSVAYPNSQSLRDGAARLSLGLGSINDKVPALVAGTRALDSGAQSLAGGATRLSSGLSTLDGGASAASDASQALASGLARLKTGADTAASGADTLSTKLRAAAAGSQTLSTGATTLADGLRTLENGATTLTNGAGTLSTGLANGVDRIPDYTTAQQTSIASVGSEVAEVTTGHEHAVVNNGAGFTPMFMSLALWVGCIALFLVLPALDKRDHGEHWWQSATRPAVTALLLAIAQAVIMMVVVDLTGELHAKNLVGLCALAILASICFMSINQACVATLAFRGRFVSIILLSLQITSMGATFPIETTPRFFQWIHPLLPMSYTQLGFRSLIAGGGVDGIYLRAVLVLLVWTALGVGFTLLGARLRRGRHPLPADNALAPTAA